MWLHRKDLAAQGNHGMKCLRMTERSLVWILLTLKIVLSGEDAFEKDLSKSPTLGRGKQGSKMDMMMMMMMMSLSKFRKMKLEGMAVF